MCGIAGFAGYGTEAHILAMTAAIEHRGPDGSGFHFDTENCVCIANRRLSVLDIPGGAQPMWNEDHSVAIVFNGEIYNHSDLRRELESCGHRFRSDHSDTEVLVHGYEQWGTGLPPRLNGMFAFAVYDRSAGRLFLARDRFGEKPCYYTSRPGFFAFASELRALSRHPLVDTSVEKKSLQKLFAYGFIPAPNSLYRNTYKLPAGYSLTFDVRSSRLTLQRYWMFRIEPVETVPRDAEERWPEQLRHLLSQAVKRRLVSDVPLGIFLSGGIDSSSVLAFAAEHSPPGTIKSFCIGFREPSYDESAHARAAAAALGSQHYEQVLSIDDAREILPLVLSRLDEPLGDGSILPTYLLSRFAREHVTVALGGDGGDELFAGYDPFKALRLSQLYQRWIPGPVHSAFRRLAPLLPISARNMSVDFKIRRGLRGPSYSQRLWNPVWLAPLEPPEIAELFDDKIDIEDLYEEAIKAWDESLSDHMVDRTLEFYTKLYLQDDILTKVDRASMMVSLEVRAPFLDNDVVDFVRTIPHHFKYRNGETKYLLKRALRGVLPPRIVDRKKKGFGIPLTQWLRELGPSNTASIPYVDAEWVNRRWQEHRLGKADHRQFLWCCLGVQFHERAALTAA